MKLEHLFSLTDDNALLQHATFSVPARKEGYTVDDNARALVLAVKAETLSADRKLLDLQRKLVSFLLLMQAEDGRFHNLMDFSKRILDDAAVGDHVGRAIWAAGAVINSKMPRGVRASAQLMFDRALPWARASASPRTRAYTCLGIKERLRVESEDANLKNNLRMIADSLVALFDQNAAADWVWFENTLTYDNPRLSQALFAAYESLGEKRYLDVAEKAYQFLQDVTTIEGTFVPVGSFGWFPRGGHRAIYDQQPIEAGAMVETATLAYELTRSERYEMAIRQALGWFFGLNSKAVTVYDASTGACYDGINEKGLNENQGAESTLAYLLAATTFAETFRGN